MTSSSPSRPLFLNALSFECTTDLYIDFLNQFFILFSLLNSARHNLVGELCRALKTFQRYLRLSRKFAHSFVAIELLIFFKNEKFHYYCSREMSIFWLNKLYDLTITVSIKKLNIHQNQMFDMFFLIFFIGGV